jgi:transcription initiation factor TFIIA small subunit
MAEQAKYYEMCMSILSSYLQKTHANRILTFRSQREVGTTPTNPHNPSIILIHPSLHSIGGTLADTLDDLISSRRIEPQLAIKIMTNFDQVIAQVLGEKVKARMSFKGHLDTYRFCDDVWTFILKDIKFKLDNSQTIEVDKVRIVSCMLYTSYHFVALLISVRNSAECKLTTQQWKEVEPRSSTGCNDNYKTSGYEGMMSIIRHGVHGVSGQSRYMIVIPIDFFFNESHLVVPAPDGLVFDQRQMKKRPNTPSACLHVMIKKYQRR